MEMKYKTYEEFLRTMATTTSNDETDEHIMAFMLKYIFKIPRTTVTCGIVYGITPQPQDIHSVAKALLQGLQTEGILNGQ